MKITLNLSNDLVRHAQALAAQENTSLAQLVEEGLQLRLLAAESGSARRTLPVHAGTGGLLKGLSGLSNVALLDAADE